ncbi:MAG TPA: YaiO family outer membrane beta-barrel protein [Verrucomicrobiae bacterium]|nr:YaiO family outer membrane beta-barrel protein [Verrucomicrobiae bacterium]
MKLTCTRSIAPLALALSLAGAVASAAPPPAPNDQATLAEASFDEQVRAARALATSGHREESLAAYTQLLQRSPGNTDVLLGRGQVYAWEKRWPEAEDDLRAATARSPSYAGAWSALGDVYLWSRRPEQAVDAYGRWIDLKPDDAAAYMARGRAHRAAGHTVPAHNDFEVAAALGANPAQVADAQRSLERQARNPEAFVPEGFNWQLLFGAGQTEFSPDRAGWLDYTLSLRRYFESWSLAAEWLKADRFRKTDDAWALDAYVDLWPRAYANLRFQQSPDAILYPETSWRAEVFQGVGQGWELSAGLDQLLFRSNTVDIYSVGAGKYVGAWYLRWKHLFTYSDSSDGNSDQLLGRWYYAGNGDDYLEFRAGKGRSNQDLAGTAGGTSARDSSSAGIAYVNFPHPQWGFKVGASYGDEEDAFVARGTHATLYYRW